MVKLTRENLDDLAVSVHALRSFGFAIKSIRPGIVKKLHPILLVFLCQRMCVIVSQCDSVFLCQRTVFSATENCSVPIIR